MIGYSYTRIHIDTALLTIQPKKNALHQKRKASRTNIDLVHSIGIMPS